VDWQCAGCEHRQHLEQVDPALPRCLVCGNPELYKKKDFPHWLGMTILVVACVASVYTYLWYDKWMTWAILIGSAVIDGVLYLSVGDAVMCYLCDAAYKGFKTTDAHRPFELTIGERYRQERIRAEQHARSQARGAHPSGPAKNGSPS
jgi:hypothetical protein